jgi:tripartite-type tricarboxylate transporter receptor subunit TctC
LAMPVQAQNYPTKPIRIIVQFGAGSTIDIIARIIGPKLHEGLGQAVVVENRPGAGGAIGMEAAAKATPDGHTLTIGATGPLVINPLLSTKSPFDPVRDFAAVSQLAAGPAVIAVHPSIPARNVKELVALAKAHPGQLNYGSPGVGTSPHLAGELFQMVSGTRMVHVPYKGNAEAITDLIGGHLSIVYTGVPPVASLAKAGKVRLLATTGTTRLAGMPELPTIAEAGLPGAEVAIWYGAIAPAATSRDIISRLNTEFVRIGALPDVRERFSQQGIESKTGSAEEFSLLIRNELIKWSRVIKTANIKVE